MSVDLAKLTKIIEIQTKISSELSLSRVMQTVTESTQELTGACGAVVEIAQGDEMVYRAASGAASSAMGVRLKVATSLSGLCVRTGEVLRCDDSETDSRVDRDACRRVGLRSMIVVPLRRENQTVGVLKVFSPTPSKFDASDVQILQMMSSLIAGAMHNASRFESAQTLSLHDALTGLPNRVLFRERLVQELANLKRSGRKLAVLYIDLDGFKPVNDRFGHKIGDELLVAVAGRMRDHIRQCDTVARLGGDEFAVLASNLFDDDEAFGVSDRLREAVECEPFELSVSAVNIGASIGLAVSGGDDSAEAILDQADMAMYTAKRQRKAAAGWVATRR